MKSNVIRDANTAIRLFRDMRKARKAGKEVAVKQKVILPVFSTGIGFLDTIEGCTLWNCRIPGVYEAAKKAFLELPYKVKYQLSSVPKDDEYAERAHFWKELLQPIMTPKQYHAAMMKIIDWYLHIKRMKKGGAVE